MLAGYVSILFRSVPTHYRPKGKKKITYNFKALALVLYKLLGDAKNVRSEYLQLLASKMLEKKYLNLSSACLIRTLA